MDVVNDFLSTLFVFQYNVRACKGVEIKGLKVSFGQKLYWITIVGVKTQATKVGKKNPVKLRYIRYFKLDFLMISWQISRWPFLAAILSGVRPSLFAGFLFSTFSINNLHISR